MEWNYDHYEQLLIDIYMHDSDIENLIEDGLESSESYADCVTENLYITITDSTHEDIGYMTSGATKAVIIPDEGDYVIKIPFLEYEDYPYTEPDIYAAAPQDIRRCFAAASSMVTTEINGRQVEWYLMEKAKMDEPRLKKETKSAMNEMGRLKAWPHWRNLTPLCVFQKEGDLDFQHHLASFLRSYDLDDFHFGNIGYNKDDRPIIIDYSEV